MCFVVIPPSREFSGNIMDQSTIQKKINHLKKEQNAILLAHNYQLPEVQDIADIVGDSLDLALKAIDTDADIIVFCGVDFMAESAKILNPEKTVLLPDNKACCPMAAMVEPQSLQAKKQQHPDAQVVCYINTSAEVKALSDVCCTSSNGAKVVKSIPSETIIFVPDYNLGSYIQRQVPDKKMILWQGMCPTHHNNISKKELIQQKKMHPSAEILVHPECPLEIIDIADQVFSTNGMVNYVHSSNTKIYIIGTEKELCYRLQKENPKKTIIPVHTAICPNMKKITLEKILNTLETLEPKITLPEEIRKKAKKPLDRMIAIGRGD